MPQCFGIETLCLLCSMKQQSCDASGGISDFAIPKKDGFHDIPTIPVPRCSQEHIKPRICPMAYLGGLQSSVLAGG